MNKNIKDIFKEKLRLKDNELLYFHVSKESVDARHKDSIYISYNIIFESTKKFNNTNIKPYILKEVNLNIKQWDKPYRPIIVGFGPAGIFASYYLTLCNASPIILERGSDMDKRIKDVENFIKNKVLSTSSNIQFGEGGAGTFSDGKLHSNVKDDLTSFLLETFVKYGAPEDILYESLPHIGTDYLRRVIKKMRCDMEKMGATFYFDTKFESYKNMDDHIKIYTDNGMSFETRHLILGLGHSARDTLKMLYDNNINMEPKSFSIGLRIEHKREKINKIQYGNAYKILPPASYKLVCHLDSGRSVYSFCMCPGGIVMPSQSEEETIVTNGMSYYDRNEENSNAALLVNIDPSDYMKNSVLDGLKFQEEYERKAYLISKDYRAPINLVKEFLEDKVAQSFRSVKPSYSMGTVFANLYDCLPDYVINSLKEALPKFDLKMKGFCDPDAILIGVETRSSCPVRILRDDSRKSNNEFIYPIGEGAGYAGGITSAALDGLKTAIKIMEE
jgi:uncharacterized FAD-dependent dehydrogenase